MAFKPKSPLLEQLPPRNQVAARITEIEREKRALRSLLRTLEDKKRHEMSYEDVERIIQEAAANG